MSGGSSGMSGAPALAAMAALRSGAGLVHIACPDDVRPIIASLVPCATTGSMHFYEAFPATVRAVGPGAGTALSKGHLKDILAENHIPVVIDADGLNTLAKVRHWWELTHERVVLTPHPGEVTRLLETTEIGTDLSRKEKAAQLASLSRSVVVLKGHRTVVSDSQRAYVNETGNAGMATGGAGDVLTGMIAAFIGQGLGCYEAAVLGVYLHGLAGDLTAAEVGQASLIASDIIDHLPQAIRQHHTA